ARPVDAAFVRQPNSPYGIPENLGRRAIQDRLLRVADSREKPNLRPADLPIRAQLLQQSRREQRVAILAPFALLHPELHPRAVNMAELQMTSLVEPQTRPANRHQKGAMFGVGTAHRQ